MSSVINGSDPNEPDVSEHFLWRKHAPLLYDLLATHALQWPSLTVQWMPEIRTGERFVTQRMLLGTHTGVEENIEQEQNQLMLLEVRLPSDEVDVETRTAEDHENTNTNNTHTEGKYGTDRAKFEIVQAINHPREVNKARYMPQNPNIIATRAVNGDVLIFDRTKHPSKPTDNDVHPNLVMKGLSGESWALAWNPHAQGSGHVYSSGENALIAAWDINQGSKNGQELQPIATYKGHTDVVEDIAWHGHHAHLFGSASDDQLAFVWDTRNDDHNKPLMKLAHHKAEVNAINFNPFNEHLLATGSADFTVALWDLRNPSACVHVMRSHTDQVLNVQWSPFSEDVLASSAADRRINIWNISRIGQEQSEEDKEDGPPELLFVHGGHTDKVADFSWNGSIGMEWTIVSVADDNVMQIWRPAEEICNSDDDNEDDDNAASESNSDSSPSKTVTFAPTPSNKRKRENAEPDVPE